MNIIAMQTDNIVIIRNLQVRRVKICRTWCSQGVVIELHAAIRIRHGIFREVSSWVTAAQSRRVDYSVRKPGAEHDLIFCRLRVPERMSKKLMPSSSDQAAGRN